MQFSKKILMVLGALSFAWGSIQGMTDQEKAKKDLALQTVIQKSLQKNGLTKENLSLARKILESNPAYASLRSYGLLNKVIGAHEEILWGRQNSMLRIWFPEAEREALCAKSVESLSVAEKMAIEVIAKAAVTRFPDGDDTLLLKSVSRYLKTKPIAALTSDEFEALHRHACFASMAFRDASSQSEKNELRQELLEVFGCLRESKTIYGCTARFALAYLESGLKRRDNTHFKEAMRELPEHIAIIKTLNDFTSASQINAALTFAVDPQAFFEPGGESVNIGRNFQFTPLEAPRDSLLLVAWEAAFEANLTNEGCTETSFGNANTRILVLVDFMNSVADWLKGIAPIDAVNSLKDTAKKKNTAKELGLLDATALKLLKCNATFYLNQVCQRVCGDNPDYGEAINTLKCLKNPSELKGVSAIDRNTYTILYVNMICPLLGKFYEHQGDFDNAEKVYKKATDISKNRPPEISLNPAMIYGDFLVRRKKIDELLAYLKNGFEGCSEHRNYFSGIVQFHRGDFAAAYKFFKRMGNDAKKSGDILSRERFQLCAVYSAFCAVASGDYSVLPESLHAFLADSSRDNERGLCHAALAMVYEYKGDSAKSVEHAKKSLETTTQETENILRPIGNYLLLRDAVQKNLPDEAEAREKNIGSDEKYLPKAYQAQLSLALAQRAFDRGDYAKAQTHVSALANHERNLSDADNSAAALLSLQLEYHRGDAKQSKKAKKLAELPSQAGIIARAILGCAAWKAGSFDEAAEYLDSVEEHLDDLNRFPLLAQDALFFLAQSKQRDGDVEKAGDYLKRIIMLEKNSYEDEAFAELALLRLQNRVDCLELPEEIAREVLASPKASESAKALAHLVLTFHYDTAQNGPAYSEHLEKAYQSRAQLEPGKRAIVLAYKGFEALTSGNFAFAEDLARTVLRMKNIHAIVADQARLQRGYCLFVQKKYRESLIILESADQSEESFVGASIRALKDILALKLQSPNDRKSQQLQTVQPGSVYSFVEQLGFYCQAKAAFSAHDESLAFRALGQIDLEDNALSALLRSKTALLQARLYGCNYYNNPEEADRLYAKAKEIAPEMAVKSQLYRIDDMCNRGRFGIAQEALSLINDLPEKEFTTLAYLRCRISLGMKDLQGFGHNYESLRELLENNNRRNNGSIISEQALINFAHQACQLDNYTNVAISPLKSLRMLSSPSGKENEGLNKTRAAIAFAMRNGKEKEARGDLFTKFLHLSAQRLALEEKTNDSH